MIVLQSEWDADENGDKRTEVVVGLHGGDIKYLTSEGVVDLDQLAKQQSVAAGRTGITLVYCETKEELESLLDEAVRREFGDDGREH
jgi:hypothetical protein